MRTEYQCTNCKKIFKSKKEGYKHYKKEGHTWGGLEHIEGNKEKANRLIKWLREHKPIDFKWVVIILLLFQLLKRDLIWLTMSLLGFGTYPNEIDYVPIFEKAGEKIGDVYATAMTRLYEIGLDFGETLYPHNRWITQVISRGMAALVIIFILVLIMFIINTIMYKKKDER